MSISPLPASAGYPATEIDEDDRFETQHSRLAGLTQGEVDLREFKAGLYRNRWLIAGIVTVSILAGLLVALLTTPIYRATATVQVDRSGPQIFEEDTQNTTGEATEDESYLQTQVEILQSRSLADRVARSLNYYSNANFFEAMEADQPEAPTGSEAWQKAVVAVLLDNLTVELTTGTRLIDVSFDSPDARTAQAVANAFGKEFIGSSLQRRFETSAYSREFLADQLDQTRQRLEQSEQALINFARNEGITDVLSSTTPPTGGSSSLTGSNLSALNTAYATARAERILAEQRWQQARSTPTMQLPEVLGNTTVQSLTTQRAQLQAELQGERDRHSAEYPTVLQLQAQLDSLDQQIQTAAARVRSSIQEQYELARSQEQQLQQDVGSLRDETLSEQSRGVQLSVLRREADTNRALYDALLQRFRELNAASGITANNISIIDEAQVPAAPIWPMPLINALIGAIIGLGLAGMIAFARERLDDAVRSPDDVERKLGLPLLGITPTPEGPDVEADLDNPHSAISEAIYALHTALALSTAHGLPRTLLITSTRPGEGKSTTSYALARELAKSGSRVVLVDADMRRPSMHHLFELDNQQGFSTLLSSGQLAEGIVKPTEVDNLSIITSGPIPPSPPRLLSRDALQNAFAQLNQRFEVIVLDSPPVLGLADALQLSSVAEASLFVIEANGGSQGQTKTALRRLNSAHANLIGAVLSKFNHRKVGYSNYGYGEGYYSYNSAGQSAG